MSEFSENNFETSVNAARGSVVSDKVESTLIAVTGSDKVTRPYDSNKTGYTMFPAVLLRA
jgi:hypothetical protein